MVNQSATATPRLLAQAVDCFTEQDLCELCSITPTTAEAWRKRGTGPTYIRAGNAFLYPREGLREYLMAKQRTPARIEAKEML